MQKGSMFFYYSPVFRTPMLIVSDMLCCTFKNVISKYLHIDEC